MVPDGDGEVTPARGHPIEGFAEGFFQAGAWVRLASGAMEDLLYEGDTRAPLPGAWPRTGLMALMPLLDPARFMWAIDQQPDSLAEYFTEPLRQVLGLPIPPENIRAIASGHTSLAEGLQRAEALLGSRQVDRVVLVGADSYLDGLTLDWLSQHGRLKSGEAPTGLLPGQAGACLMVERGVDRVPASESGCHILASTVKSPPPGEFPGATQRGQLLAEAIQEVLSSGSPGTSFRGELVLDLNGEQWKAHAWGHAQVLLRQRVDFDGCGTLLPCESIGEVGAASGLLGAGLALTSLLDPGSAAGEALICGLADSGQVSAVLVRGVARAPFIAKRS
ncbi:hypothetical protein OV208_13545 [Corallococcus sp. bb12-1]|uniref:hypothetical protein n=1 Tax=Corallococcus sp. bb12-1 TaxID=2996784 RepID=UPI002270E598|nr:hypothetical protein [Corallococcus sp. bb12-1]MCY1042343.1 hypothetical protein [Corallococcus sp. bb12-1]